MAKYKKDYRVPHDPKSPYKDLRDVDWEEESNRAISPEDYKKHIQKKYKLMNRNMKDLKRMRGKNPDYHAEQAEYETEQLYSYKKRGQPKGVYPFVYTAKEESMRDMEMYKTINEAMNTDQDLAREIIEKKGLFGKKRKKLGPKKKVKGISVRDAVRLAAEQKLARQEFVKDFGDYDKAAKGLKPKKETRTYKNNTYKEGQ